MKSLFLGLTFLLASFSSTTNEEKTIADEFVCSNWVKVIVECDNDFWLCTDGQTMEEFLEDATYFSQGRC